MHGLTILLGVTAALLHGVAFTLYSIQTKMGQSSPNPASWALWAFLAVINALTFHGMTNALVTLQFFTGSVGCLATFLFALAIGKFSWPTTKEWRLFGLGVLGTLVWWIFKSATGANMIIFVALTISFIPTYEGVWRDPHKETPRSWVLWTLAFLVTTINVIVNWKGQPLNLVMPIGGAILHGTVAVLSTQNRKERFRLARA